MKVLGWRKATWLSIVGTCVSTSRTRNASRISFECNQKKSEEEENPHNTLHHLISPHRLIYTAVLIPLIFKQKKYKIRCIQQQQKLMN